MTNRNGRNPPAAAAPFGLLVRKARRLRDWTQQRLADELGVLKPRVSAVERGATHISPQERVRWADRLGIARETAVPELYGPAPGAPRAVTLMIDGSGRVADPVVVVPATDRDRAALDAIGWTAPYRYEVGSFGFANLARDCAREGVRIVLAYDLPPLA